MRIWKQEIDLLRIAERSKNTMVEILGMEFTAVGDDYLTARMPVDHRTKQPIGIMHGGASCALAETVGSTAANFCVTADRFCVGLDINVNHPRYQQTLPSGPQYAGVEYRDCRREKPVGGHQPPNHGGFDERAVLA
jgi:hypothetical protein